MSDSKFQEIGRILREHRRFAILGHVRPDGDALGSQLALALSLQALGKEVRVHHDNVTIPSRGRLQQAMHALNRPLIELKVGPVPADSSGCSTAAGNAASVKR
jgi:nanoRNase/pAp phosphatase (c-di-AMP/oligoRNAs hydrolase)